MRRQYPIINYLELYKALREVMDIARQVDHDEEDFKNLDREI